MATPDRRGAEEKRIIGALCVGYADALLLALTVQS